MVTALLNRLRGLRQRPRVSRELDDELQFHLAAETQANLARGLPIAEAERQARLSLGGVDQTKETIRDVRVLSIEWLWRDLRYALRVLRRKPGFSVVAVLTLALGIGVNVTSFAVAYHILARPLPYADPSRLVIVNLLFANGGDLGFTPQTLQEWRPRFRLLASSAAYYRRDLTVIANRRSTVVSAALVTDDFFKTLGTPAEAGHFPDPGDAGGVVISRRALGQLLPGDSGSAIGALVSISGKPYTVRAVMPSDFAFPADETAVWVPSAALTPGTKLEDAGYSRIVARMTPGVTLDQLTADVDRVRLELNPQSRQRPSIEVLGESVVSGLRTILIVTMVGAVLVLLIACANVATLFIGRDVGRQRELAARMALGATGPQIARTVIVEAFVIAGAAALLGMALGAATLRIFISQATGTLPGVHRVGLGVPVLFAIAALTAFVTAACALVPARHAARADIRPFIRMTSGSRPGAWRLRWSLAALQIALSCVLLVGAGLLTRTLSRLGHEDGGFRAEGVVAAKIVLSDNPLFNGAGRETFVPQLLERIRALPGVASAGFGTTLPPRRGPISVAIRMIEANRDETGFLKAGGVTPGYFAALGNPIVRGRDFVDGDAGNAVILSESAARFIFTGKDPIGRKMIRMPAIMGPQTQGDVIGIVRDTKDEELDAPATRGIYVPWTVRPMGSAYLVVRGTIAADQLAREIRSAVAALDPSVPVPEIKPLSEIVAQTIAARRVRALPAVSFGALSLVIALVGVLATLSMLIVERRRDLAIKSALGASPAHLIWSVLSHGLAIAVCGTIAGLALGSVAARGLASLLYGIGPRDPIAFAGAAGIVLGGALVTTYAASRQAARVQPADVLKLD